MATKRSDSPRRRAPTIPIDIPGARLVAVHGGRARTELPVAPDPRRPIETPALVALGNAAALAAAASVLAPTGEVGPEGLPLTLQLSLDLFRPDSRGPLTADAEITYRGRATLVVDVRVRDAKRRLVAALVTTQLLPRRADGAAARLAS
jgi:acyl-coenzyme A thioesterase PaaI-like protein